uniref:Metalloendopeptidase n=1 Tax=Trichuris muris TaxID=70415 RepID=A0A5S6QTU7_TRIMR
MLSWLALFTLLTGSVGRQPKHRSWMGSGKFEGDIVGISYEDFDQPGLMTRSSVRNKHLLWKDAEVPYEMSPLFSAQERQLIQRAIRNIEENSCIRFTPRTGQADYIYVSGELGCFSMVGRMRGRQVVSLGSGCLYREVILHELLHALGFWHEQSRTDRDLFVKIRRENVIPNMVGQFRKIDPPYLDYLDETYDYYSIMHYDSKAFSRNGQDTIEAPRQELTSVIGKAMHMSEKDVRKLNKLYNCPSMVATTSMEVATTITQSKEEEQEEIPILAVGKPEECRDRFDDCAQFARYCRRFAFRHVMDKHCPKTCHFC